MLTVVPVIINTVAPVAGDVIVEVGGVMSGVGVGAGVGIGMPGLLVMPHPLWRRIELIPASPIRTPVRMA
jgi:hypothetical protein